MSATQRPAPRRDPRSGDRRATVVIVTVLALVSVYFLLPVVWVAVASTKSSADLFGTFGLWFHEPRPLENWALVMSYEGGIFLRWMANSALYAGVGGLFATLFAAMAGYALAKFRFPGREGIFNVILGGVLVPATALALPLYLLTSQVQLTNTYWAVLLPAMVSPFGVYLCRIYAESAVSDEIIEAGRIDGANEFRIFSGLVLRIMTPALVTVFLFSFVSIWNNFFLSLVMLSDRNLYPITLGLATWLGYADRQPLLYQLTIGGAFLAIIPLVALTLSLQRFWRAGLTEGSVKA